MVLFQKGMIPWNKGLEGFGKEFGFQEGNKLGRKFFKGHKLWEHPNVIKNQFKEGEVHHNMPHSEETKHKISINNKSPFPEVKAKISANSQSSLPEVRAKISKNSKAHLYAVRKKQSITKQGISESEWNGFAIRYSKRLRNTMQYKHWRSIVFERDSYTCQICGTRGCYLHPHHLKSFSKYPSDRFDINNGITLCMDCHGDIHNIPYMGGK